MKKGKLISALVIAGIMLLMLAGTAVASAVNVSVNGNIVVFPDQQPYINAENRTMVPLRPPMEAMGATVKWDANTKQATIIQGDKNVVFTVGIIKYNVGGRTETMDTRAELVNGRVAIPIKYAAQALGATVSWDAATKTVVIRTGLESKMTVILGKDINRLKTYPCNVGIVTPMINFKEKNLSIAEFVVKETGRALNLQDNQRFFSDPVLVYEKSNTIHIRGILQTINPDGTVTEQDMEYVFEKDSISQNTTGLQAPYESHKLADPVIKKN